MIYIIEGADGTGKTTLANYLSEKTGFPIRHRSKPKNDNEKLYMMKDYVKDIDSGVDMIWDRSFYSELVYGDIMRDEVCLNRQQVADLENKLLESGAIIFHCTGDPLETFTLMHKRGEDYITNFDDHCSIITAFNILFTKNKIPTVTYRVAL